MRFVFLIVVALLVSSPAHAQTLFVWSGGNGDWSDASKWSPNGVPAATDTAVVDGGSTSIVTLTANTTVAGLEVKRLGVVAGDFDLTVTSRFLWAGGGSGFETFRGTGSITNAASSTLHMAEPTTQFQMSSGRTLVNDGTILWDGSGSWRGQGRLVNNGEIELAMGESDAFGFIFSSLPDAITNSASGVIRRTGDGSALYSAGLVNNGLIRVEAGVLDLGGFNSTGTTGTGSIEAQSGAELRVSGRGNNTQTSVTGDAVTIASFGGRLTVTDTYDVTTTRIVGTGGELALNTDATTETLVMEGGVLGGSGTVTVTSSMSWTGGSMEGTGTTVLGPSVPLDISGTQVRVSGSRTLRLEGTTTWSGEADIGSGTSTSTLVNAGAMTSSGAGERMTNFVQFRNEGTLIHDGGTLFFQSPMDNTGEIRIQDGALKLNSNGTDTGRYTIGDTGQMEFVFGTRTLAEGAEVVGAGTVVFTAGTVKNRATWRPGASPGVLTIDSNWPKPAPEAVLDMEVGGLAAGTEFDQLNVTGAATLGGTLRVTLTDGFTPTLGDRFQLIAAAGGATGAFDQLELPTGLEAFVATSATGAELVIGTPVANEGDASPTVLALHPPAPNPTRGVSSMQVDLPSPARVRLSVYDALGREVAVALDEDRPAGRHTVELAVNRLATGVYVVRLVVGNELATQRLTVVR